MSPHKWEITWHMRGPVDSTIGATSVVRGYGLSKGKDIIVKYRDSASAKEGRRLKIKPSTRWLLEYAFDVFKEEFEPKDCTLFGIEVKEKETKI